MMDSDHWRIVPMTAITAAMTMTLTVSFKGFMPYANAALSSQIACKKRQT